MKRVIIVRHAKAVPYGYDDDFTRDLTDRGVNDAGLVSRELKRLGIKPDKMISSPANRALQTALIFSETLEFNKKQIQEIQNLYHGLTTSEFLNLVKQLPNDVNTVFFFGHNPGFHYFAGNLLKDYLGEMPTCSTVGIEFNVDSWKKVEARSGSKGFHLVPKMFK